MTETVAIIISTLGACGAFGAGVCKYYSERNQDHHEVVVDHGQDHQAMQIIDRVPNNTPVFDDSLMIVPMPILKRDPIRRPPTPSVMTTLGEVIAQMEQRNSEEGRMSDSEMDISIHIHTTNHEIKE